MKKMAFIWALFTTSTSFAWGFGSSLVEQRPDVQQFIQYMAQQYHFDANELTDMFNTIQTVPTSQMPLNQRPAIQQIVGRHDFVPWYQYRDQFMTEQEISNGLQFWQINNYWLGKAQKKYNIPADIIVATIGIETKYGQQMGKFPVFKTLAVLAFDYGPRKDYFTHELIAFLLYCRHNHLDTLSIQGSYTGAIGLPQFMPSNIGRYAVDFDHKGSIDLINHNPDAIGSIAHFYSAHHWIPGEPIALPAKIKNLQAFQLLRRKHAEKMTIADFEKYGIYPVGQVKKTETASLIKLNGQKESEYWLTFNNFKVLKNYNNSTDYAMALFQLSNEISTRYAQKEIHENVHIA